jgi:hypothetical protein
MNRTVSLTSYELSLLLRQVKVLQRLAESGVDFSLSTRALSAEHKISRLREKLELAYEAAR